MSAFSFQFIFLVPILVVLDFTLDFFFFFKDFKMFGGAAWTARIIFGFYMVSLGVHFSSVPNFLEFYLCNRKSKKIKTKIKI